MGGGVGVGDGVDDKVASFALRGDGAYDGGFRVVVEIVGLRKDTLVKVNTTVMLLLQSLVRRRSWRRRRC